MGVRRLFYRFYWAAEKLIAPRLKYSQTVYEEVLSKNTSGVDRWLDLGCGHHLLPTWRMDAEQALVQRADLLVGMDYDHLSLTKHRTIEPRVRGTMSSIPFADSTFDLVTANMVFEHIREPELQFAELLRVLKPNGTLIFHTPNSRSYLIGIARSIPEFIKGKLIWLLEQRKEEDVFPAFYKVNSTRDIDRLARISGFEIASMQLIVSSASFTMIPPLVILELLWLRFLMTRIGKPFRTNIIAILRKPAESVGDVTPVKAA